MPFNDVHLRVTMNGEVANGQDIWSAGFSLAAGEDANPTTVWNAFNAPGGLTELANLIGTFIATPAVKVPSGVTLEYVKVAYIGLDGKYLFPAVEMEKFSQGNLNASYIPQAAIVNTLDSGKWKDPGKYNRFYLPVALGGNGDNWCLTPAEQAAYAAATANFIGEVNDLMDEIDPVNAVRVAVMSSTGTGSSLPVQSVRIGRVVDNQRRRRNALAENYVTEPVVSI